MEAKRRNVQRRDFLKTAAATAAGLTVVKAGSVRGAEAGNKLLLGIIGSGGRGTFIADLFAKRSETKVVACHDYFKDRVDSLGGKFNIEASRRYTGLKSYRDLIAGKVDAVAVTSPPYFHPEQVVAALEAGKHVYLAKPIAVDVPGCTAIVRAANKVQGKLSTLVDFQTRNDPLFREAARRVQEGQIGDLVCGQCFYHTGRLGRRAAPGGSEARLRNWVFDIALSGDIIVEQNVHVIDVANWYVNSHPIKAHGTGGRKARTDVGDCWDHFVVSYTYPNDVHIAFSSSQFLVGFHDMCIRVYGSLGTVDSHYGGPVLIRGKKSWKGGKTPQIYRNGAVNNVRDFHASIVNSKPLNNAQVSADSTMAGILGRIAAYENRTVTWNEMLKANTKLDAKLNLK